MSYQNYYNIFGLQNVHEHHSVENADMIQ